MNKGKHEHHFNMKISQSIDGDFVAQVVEIPSITVQLEKRENLKDEITLAMDKYFRAYPEEDERILQLENGVKEMLETTTFEQMTIVA